MNKILLCITFSIILINAAGQDFYGVFQNTKTPYYLSKKKILVKYKESAISMPADPRIINKVKSRSIVNEKEALQVFELNEEIDRAGIIDLITNFEQSSEVEYATPCLENKEGRIIAAITNTVIVGLKSTTDFWLLQNYCTRNNLRIIKKYEYDNKVIFLSVEKNASKNAIEIAYDLSITDLVRYAEPNYLIPSAFGTNDPAFQSQWALNSMSIPSAWQLSTGCSSIRVAILDNGVELNHPDLQANLLPGFDATGGGSGGGSTGTSYEDAHGTNCAGIVGAIANNNLGTAGVAYNSRIVPVKVGYGSFLDFTYMATGINWITSNNAADIISFSAGSIGVSSQLVTDAINAATTSGRGNLGIPFFTITQNDGSSTIAYPANLENTIAVGSIDNNGNRASTSNYGTGIDIVAPGVCIYTTDMQGSAGQTANDYWTCFSGTSAACPNAAGVMALILSVNPMLSLSQARQILESTTDKINGYSFSSGVANQPNGTWNNELGYGRVNAYQAVLRAVGQITGSSIVCNTSSAFTLNNAPAGSTVTWQATPTNLFATSSGTGASAQLATANSGVSGSGTITFTISTVCGNPIQRQATFWVGKPNSPGTFTTLSGNLNNMCINSQAQVLISSVPGASSYVWTSNNPSGLRVEGSGLGAMITGMATSVNSSLGYWTFNYGGENTCGTTTALYGVVIKNCRAGGGGTLRAAAYPNPSSDSFTVKLGEEDNKEQAEVSLLNKSMERVYFIRTEEKEITISTSTLLPGLYYLNIKKNEQVIQQQLVVKH